MSTRILIGDVRDRLRELPDESVHCCVTSPPYFGLRDYQTASWEGGDPACDHAPAKNGARADRQRVQHENYAPPSGWTNRDATPKIQSECPCGATRTDKQIGLEDTPAAFVAVMVEVFREVRRVLRNDGTLWLNLGDSYASGGGAHGGREDNQNGVGAKRTHDAGGGDQSARRPPSGLKPKDLIGIPWRVAFALQADGWYLRQDIIWAKPNPMPESVTDRCTKAHEYLFLLSKSARYHYDADPIREEPTGRTGEVRFSSVPDINGKAHAKGFQPDGLKGANRRSVWTVATQPFSEAHFATFPPALIEPCILAGCPKDCCAKCGAPVVREVERTAMVLDRSDRTHELGRTRSSGTMLEPPTSKTTGWSPSCSCGAGTARGVCLDPFGGAGTTGLVADRLGRDAILIELNPEYAAIADRRINADAGMFAEVAAE